jgi:hypothetical protein
MPKQYEAIRDKLSKKMSYDQAQEHAAKIYNAKHPSNPVTGHHSEKKSSRRSKKD